MFRSAFASIAIALLLGTTTACAQDSPDAINVRSSRLIDSTMAALNIRAERFNEELGKVNAAKPMEPTSLVKDSIPKNRQKIKDFLEYLEVYRSLCDQQRGAIQDSIRLFRSIMPSRYRDNLLKDFLEAYDLDQTAFTKYTVALTKLFTNIDAVLVFVLQSNVTIKDGKLQFTDKAVYEKYSGLIAAVEKSNKRLINAGAASQRATIDASTAMQKAYGSIKK